MKTVLFACVHNAGRSQMASGFFNAHADPSLARSVSAGTQPGNQVHPIVVEIMNEVGINLSEVKPRLLSDELVQGVDLLVTMGCGDACPVVPGLKREDWPLEDPKGVSEEKARLIRDEIFERVKNLLGRIEQI